MSHKLIVDVDLDIVVDGAMLGINKAWRELDSTIDGSTFAAQDILLSEQS